MATHSSVLAWRIPGMAGPGGLPSMGSYFMEAASRHQCMRDLPKIVQLSHCGIETE